MGQDDSGAAGGFEALDDVEHPGVVAVFGWRHPIAGEALVGVLVGVDAVGPAFVAEGRVGDDEIELFEVAAFEVFGIGEGVAVFDLVEGTGHIMQHDVHAGQNGGGAIVFLTVDIDLTVGGLGQFEQKGTATAGGIESGGFGAEFFGLHVEDARQDAAHFGRGVKLAFAFAAILGEVTHEVLVGVAEDVVSGGTVTAEVEFRFFEDSDQVGESLYFGLSGAEFAVVVEVSPLIDGQFVGSKEGFDDFFIDAVADIAFALELAHIVEAGTFGDGDGPEPLAGVAVGNVFDEQQYEHVVFILAGVHGAP